MVSHSRERGNLQPKLIIIPDKRNRKSKPLFTEACKEVVCDLILLE